MAVADLLLPDDEILMLEQLLSSDGWKVVQSRFRPMIEKLLHQIISHQTDESPLQRDRDAERAAAMLEILDWPEKRITTLMNKLRTNEQD